MTWDPAVLDGAVSASRRERLVILTERAGDLDPIADRLRGLAAFGHQVVLVWLHGTPGPTLDTLTTRRPVSPGMIRRPVGLVRQAVTTPVPHWRGDRQSLVGAVRLDPRTVRVLGRAHAVVPVGTAAREVAAEQLGPGSRVIDPTDLQEWAILDSFDALEERVAQGPGEIETDWAGDLVTQLGILEKGVPAARQPVLQDVAEVLHDRGEYDLAVRVLSFVDDLPADLPEDPVEAALRRGWKVLAATSARGERQPGASAAVTDLVHAADRALESGEEQRAASAASLALRLLFHRELHADGTSSPLVQEPDTFLASWRSSRIGRLLAAPVPQEGTGRRLPRGAGVLVEPGSYPRFAAPLVEELAQRAQVHESDLAQRAGYQGLGVRPDLVEQRLAQALGRTRVSRYDLLEQTEQVESVFVDWADQAALATVMNCAAGVPLTLRIHSMDALSCWIHLIDWSRVTHLVVVSDPLRLLVTRLLGSALDHTEVHVVPNVVDRSRIVTTKAEGHRRRLLMVGWAQRVKDPLFALDVLAGLLAHDPTWRLRLVGADFVPGAVRSQQTYAEAFRRRLAEPDVRHAVELVGYTHDLAPHLEASGFVLSTSRRESFGVGLVEAAAAGAVPVVRDWPIFAPLGGARSIFPDRWVVDTVDEAVSRIRELAQDPGWAEASSEAQAVVAEHFDSERAAGALLALILP